MNKPLRTIGTTRQLLNEKLLTTLEDDDKVAAVFTAGDLETLIELLRAVPANQRTVRQTNLLDGSQWLTKVLK